MWEGVAGGEWLEKEEREDLVFDEAKSSALILLGVEGNDFSLLVSRMAIALSKMLRIGQGGLAVFGCLAVYAINDVRKSEFK